MKSKFTLGFLTGFMNVPNAWPGSQVHVPILEPLRVPVSAPMDTALNAPRIKQMVFECRRIDEDHAAIFEFVEVQ